MKKFLIALSIILLLVILYLGYELKQSHDKLLMSEIGDNDIISQLENQLSIKTEELSGLQSENQLLKTTLSGTMELLNSLQIEKSGVQKNLSGCEKKLEKYIEYIEKLVEEKYSNVGNNTTASNNNATLINGKEIGKIKQVYTDGNGNKKIEITYGGQLTDGATCGVPESPICYINENPKTEIFTVSDNVQIFTYAFNGYVEENRISFNRFEQKFKETNNDEYGYFKLALFRIAVENNIVVKIEEQYQP